MSTATEETVPPAAPEQPGACPNCGATLQPGQDWCLECGTAVAHEPAGGPGRWGPAAAVLAVVIVLAGAGIAFAWAALSSDSGSGRTIANRPPPSATEAQPPTSSAPTPTSTAPTPTSTTPGVTSTTPGGSAPGDVTPGTTTTPGAGATPNAGTAPATVGSWPPGKRAYSVILLSATSRGAADRVAKRLAGQGVSVGILDSSKFPSLEPGYSVVFSGQYADVGAAQQAAQRLSAQAPGAYAKLVSPR
jgi:hypothetical protein